MEKFERTTSLVIPLPLKDVDTDMIIPAQYLTSISRSGFGDNLFQRLREQDPRFPLNQEQYRGAEILLADDNFGCGSSREHAVWALLGWGIRVVIAKSFADIFRGNATKNGLVLVVLESEVIERFQELAAAGPLTLTVDLAAQLVTRAAGEELHFDFDQFRKYCIMNGLDDLDYLLSKKAEIEAWDRQRRPQPFFSSLVPNHALGERREDKT